MQAAYDKQREWFWCWWCKLLCFSLLYSSGSYTWTNIPSTGSYHLQLLLVGGGLWICLLFTSLLIEHAFFFCYPVSNSEWWERRQGSTQDSETRHSDGICSLFLPQLLAAWTFLTSTYLNWIDAAHSLKGKVTVFYKLLDELCTSSIQYPLWSTS